MQKYPYNYLEQERDWFQAQLYWVIGYQSKLQLEYQTHTVKSLTYFMKKILLIQIINQQLLQQSLAYAVYISVWVIIDILTEGKYLNIPFAMQLFRFNN